LGGDVVISQCNGAPGLLAPLKRMAWAAFRNGSVEPLILICRIRETSELASLISMSQRPAIAGAYHPE
jgi:hypothetical protein